LEGHLATYDNEPNETASVEKYLECVRGMKGFEDLRATLGLDGDQKTQRELARKAGITHQGINERVRKLKERIRKIHGDELKAML
jgi:transcription initiation factor TFIIIB Brf1 subunit/transcription initiation factor TFIIB